MPTIPQALALGWTYHQAGNLAGAEQAYRYVLQEDPGQAKAWCLLGSVSQVQGRLDESVCHYREALRLQPDFAEARNNMGLALDHLGQRAEAMECFREALRLKAHYPDPHNNLGNALQAAVRIEAATAQTAFFGPRRARRRWNWAWRY